MARSKGSFGLAGAVEPKAAAPLDARAVVKNMGELTAVGSFPYPYIGMETYVVSENKKYRLTANDPTTLSNWEEVGAGGGSYISGDGIDVDGDVIRTDDTVYRTPDQTSADLADGDYIPFYDVSTSHKKKTLWGNIKTLLEDIFQNKLTFGDGINIDQNNEISTERMESSDLDDLDLDGAGQSSGMVIDLDGNDLVVGTVIQNGVRKPLYQKTVYCGSVTSTGSKEIQHGIANIESIWNCQGIWKQFVINTTTYVGFCPSFDGNAKCYVYCNEQNITLFASGIFIDPTITFYITLQYTKTT